MSNKYQEYEEKMRLEYKKYFSVFSPALKKRIVFAADGFNHLLFSRRKRRSEKERLYKLSLLHFVRKVIRKSKKHDGYRKILISPFKYIEYGALKHEVVGGGKVKVIVRRINGKGGYYFWSVMK